jgi:hypothetical protein
VGLNPSCGCDLPLCVAITTTGFTVNTCHCAFFFVCYVLKMNTYWQSEMSHQGHKHRQSKLSSFWNVEGHHFQSHHSHHFGMWKVCGYLAYWTDHTSAQTSPYLCFFTYFQKKRLFSSVTKTPVQLWQRNLNRLMLLLHIKT